ncbi:unnamed protein product [Sphagnum tenellum]
MKRVLSSSIKQAISVRAASSHLHRTLRPAVWCVSQRYFHSSPLQLNQNLPQEGNKWVNPENVPQGQWLKQYCRDLTAVAKLVGAGASEGGMDASNMLKPALARGDLACVGATTLDEYRKYIEKDAALARRSSQF